MAWCPKCKNEYIEGITRCTDCNVDLVDKLEEEQDVEYIHLDGYDNLDDIVDYLHQASIDSAQKVYLDDDDIEVISVNRNQFSDARLHLSVYLQNESALNLVSDSDTVVTNTIEDESLSETTSENDDFSNDISINEEDSSMDDSSMKSSSSGPTYTKLSDKYEDVKSSAYTLLFVGIIGLIAMILERLGVYNIPFSSQTKWLFYTVMGGVFIVFIISGIISAMHAKQLKIDAEKEDELIDNILTWFKDNYTRESIDASVDTAVQKELLYFNRAEYIKNAIMHQFEDADEPLIDSLIENIYQDYFES